MAFFHSDATKRGRELLIIGGRGFRKSIGGLSVSFSMTEPRHPRPRDDTFDPCLREILIDANFCAISSFLFSAHGEKIGS